MSLKKLPKKRFQEEKPQSIILPLILFIIGLIAMGVIVTNLTTLFSSGSNIFSDLSSAKNH